MKGLLFASAAMFGVSTASAECAPAQDAVAPAAQAQPATQNAPQLLPGAPETNSPATAAALPSELGEVVVVARKITENVQKAPASIVAVSGAELQSQGVTNPQALEKFVPSVSLRSEGPVTQTFIRGVGSNIDIPYVDPAVAFVENGIVIPRYGTSGLVFDLSSVQVISGPQGTLYGGSAAGGAINLLTQQPGQSFSGDALLDVGDYANVHVAVDQNAPISDTLSLRGAIDYDRHDGYESRGFDAENGIKGRLSVLAQPTSDLRVLAFFSGYDETGEPPAAVNHPFQDPSDHWSVPVKGPIFGNPLDPALSSRHLQSDIAGANIEWRLGDNVFTYIPGYVRTITDYEEFTGDLPLTVHNSDSQHSEELRWGRTFGRVKVSAGVFYLQDLIEFYDYLGAPVLPGPPYLLTIPIIDLPHQTDTSYAGFGQAIWSATDRLRVTVGARYSYDSKTSNGFGTVGTTYLPFTFNQSRETPDWKVGIDYDLAPRVLVYTNAQSGYLPLGYAPVPSTPQRDNYVPPSRLLAFSGGFKSRFFDNRLELNDELYYYDYINYQVVNFNTRTALTTTLPARRSTIYGDEIDMRLLLPADTEVDAGLNIMSAHYNDFRGPGFNYKEFQMVDAPTANINAGIQHAAYIGSGSLIGRVQTHYESGHWGEFDHAPGTHQPAYTKTDLTLTYKPGRGRWSVEVYADNIENAAIFGSLNAGGQPGPASGYLEPPRTFGMRLHTSWN